MVTDITPRSRRTRLTPEREQEVFETVLDLVREQGYEALTMDAVATRSRSSKATLYRQWESKPRLVATALRHAKRPWFEEPDTGSLRGDLIALGRRVGPDTQEDSALQSALANAIKGDKDLHGAVREVLIEPALQAPRAAIHRAIERGELAADIPALGFLVHMLVGAIITRQLLDDEDPDPDFMTRYIEAVVLPALGVG